MFTCNTVSCKTADVCENVRFMNLFLGTNSQVSDLCNIHLLFNWFLADCFNELLSVIYHLCEGCFGMFCCKTVYIDGTNLIL